MTEETEEKLEIPLADGTSEAFLYREEKGCRPGVLYLTDIGGIRDANREMARRLDGRRGSPRSPRFTAAGCSRRRPRARISSCRASTRSSTSGTRSRIAAC